MTLFARFLLIKCFFLTLGLAVLFAVSCGNKTEKEHKRIENEIQALRDSANIIDSLLKEHKFVPDTNDKFSSYRLFTEYAQAREGKDLRTKRDTLIFTKSGYINRIKFLHDSLVRLSHD